MLRREKLTNEVSANIESTLTISLALKAAAKFSEGAAITEGKGQLGKSYRGTFNICYWVQVEGLSKLWVVRFPLIGLLPMDAMIAKFNCEIATLKFLREKTKVRVPKLIGYGLGDDDISIPFMITENIVGLPLTICWKDFGGNDRFVESILNSLAQQYLELFLHPFDRIGSLCLTPDGKGWDIGTSPISVDQFDTSQDGFQITLSKPHASSIDYYNSQAHLFERRLTEQRNSVFDEPDAIGKFVTPEVFRRIIPHFINGKFNNGPFFLFHLDLHATNVIVNRHFKVEAILDWEFTSAVPTEVAFSPPRCLMNQYEPDDMALDSENYKSYESRLRNFTEQVEKHLSSSYSLLSELGIVILTQLRGALTERRAFFAWSASDFRKMFLLLWDHLALTTPIAIQSRGDVPTTEDVVFETEQKLIDKMSEIIGKTKLEDWVAERLASLRAYVLQRDAQKGTIWEDSRGGK